MASRDKNLIYNQYLKNDFQVGLDNLNPKREIVRDTQSDFEALKNILLAYYKSRIASLKGKDAADLGRRGFSGADAGNDNYFDSTTRAIALGAGTKAPGEPNDGDAELEGLRTDLQQIERDLAAALLATNTGDVVFDPPDNPRDIPASGDSERESENIGDVEAEETTNIPSNGSVKTDFSGGNNPFQAELDRIADLAGRILGGEVVTTDDFTENYCKDDIEAALTGLSELAQGRFPSTGLDEDGLGGDFDEDREGQEEEASAEEECGKLNLRLIELILFLTKILQGILTTEREVLAKIYPIVQAAQKIVAIWLNPAMAGEIVQDLVGVGITMAVDLMTKQVVEWFNSLGLACLISGTQEAVQEVMGAIAGIGDLGAAAGSLAEFNKKWVDEAALTLDDPAAQTKKLLGIAEGSEEEERLNSLGTAEGWADLAADHAGTSGTGLINLGLERMGFRGQNGQDVVGYDQDTNQPTTSVDVWQSVLASPAGPAVRGIVNTGLGLVSVTKDTWKDLNDAGLAGQELTASLGNLGEAASDRVAQIDSTKYDRTFGSADGYFDSRREEREEENNNQRRSRRAEAQTITQEGFEVIEDFFFFYETLS